AKDCLLLPSSGADLESVARMVETAVSAGTNHWANSWFQLVKGLAEYRQGRFASAVEWSQKALSRTGENFNRDVEAYMVLAIARHQLKQTDEAQATLAKGLEVADTRLPKLDSGDLGGAWLDWIIAH